MFNSFKPKHIIISMIIAGIIKHYVYKIGHFNFEDGKLFSLNNLYDIIFISIIYGIVFFIVYKILMKTKQYKPEN